MNSGPGNASSVVLHEKHHNAALPRFAGWWGHNKERRFKMEPQFDPVKGAEGWQISNLPILSLAPYLASVDMFDEIGMDAIIEKRNKITAYLEFVLQEIDKEVDSTLKLLLQPILPKEVASCLSFTWEGRSLLIT
jgi:kynureninase